VIDTIDITFEGLLSKVRATGKRSDLNGARKEKVAELAAYRHCDVVIAISNQDKMDRIEPRARAAGSKPRRTKRRNLGWRTHCCTAAMAAARGPGGGTEDDPACDGVKVVFSVRFVD